MEAQKNRQRRAGEASSAGRERDRDRDRDRERDRDRSKMSTSEAALPALMDTNMVEGTSMLTDRERKTKKLYHTLVPPSAPFHPCKPLSTTPLLTAAIILLHIISLIPFPLLCRGTL